MKLGKQYVELHPLEWCSYHLVATLSFALKGDVALSAALSHAAEHGVTDCYDVEGRLCVTELLTPIVEL